MGFALDKSGTGFGQKFGVGFGQALGQIFTTVRCEKSVRLGWI